MYKKYLELKNTRADALKTAEQAVLDGDGARYDQAMDQVKALNESLSRIEKLLDEDGRYPDLSNLKTSILPGSTGDEATQESGVLTKLLSSESYKKTFLKAIREGVSPKRFTAGFEDLYKAMTIAGGDPAGSEGGFLVPQDFEVRVIELAKDLVDLSSFANVEPVTSPVGWRNVELSAARTRMSVVGEGQPIPAGEGPKFKRVDFSCKTYGDRILVSGDLMENADVLMEYLAKWFADKFVATKNGLILDKLNSLPFSAIQEETDAEVISALKRVLNKDLRTAVSKKALFLTNQDGYDTMDNLVDNTGRAFLKPDLSGDFNYFKNRPVIYGDNEIIDNIEESDSSYAPVYIGDLASFVSLFIRQGIRIAVTNVGGDAWATGGYEVRVMVSMDAQTVDEGAMVKRGLALS